MTKAIVEQLDRTDAESFGATLRIVDLPVAEPEIELCVVGFRETFRGVRDVFESDGSVEVVSFERARRESRYRASWR